jgi:hypothetical protein
MAKVLIVIGIVLIAMGVVIKAGVPLGRLPGDIIVRRGSGTFYFPIVTCVIVSVVLSVISAILRRF